MKIPARPPKLAELFQRFDIVEKFDRIMQVGPEPDGRYLHWEETRHREPPAGLSREEWWVGMKMARSPHSKAVPLTDNDSVPFRYMLPDSVLRLLHEIDKNAAFVFTAPEDLGERLGSKQAERK